MTMRSNPEKKLQRTPHRESRPTTRKMIPLPLRPKTECSVCGHAWEQAPTCLAVPGEIDPGIRQAVQRLQDHHIETCESCEGGPGHAYPEPTVAFYGGPEDGWRALAVCFAYGLPVSELRRVWSVLDRNEPTGPLWELTFRMRMV
jgi:hypothetical protein